MWMKIKLKKLEESIVLIILTTLMHSNISTVNVQVLGCVFTSNRGPGPNNSRFLTSIVWPSRKYSKLK